MIINQCSEFPTLNLFDRSVFKEILDRPSPQPKINKSKTSHKMLHDNEQFSKNILFLNQYDQFREQILKQVCKYVNISPLKGAKPDHQLLGFRCFTFLKDKYLDLRGSNNYKSIKSIIQMLYQQVDQKIQNAREDLISLKNEIAFLYYEISLNYQFQSQFKSLSQQTQSGFLNFFSELKYCGQDKEETNKLDNRLIKKIQELLQSSLMKFKRDLFLLHYFKGKFTNERKLQILSDVITNYRKFFCESGQQQLRKDSKLQKKHFDLEMRKVFNQFLDIIDQDKQSIFDVFSLKIICSLSQMKQDWFDTNKIEYFSQIKAILLFCDHLGNTVINPQEFYSSSHEVYDSIIKQISSHLIQSEPKDAFSERSLIQKFKDKVELVHKFKIFEVNNFITQSYQIDNFIQQEYIPLMLRQVICFLQIINMHKQITQQLGNEYDQERKNRKKQFQKQLNILLYFYQLQRDNGFLQFQAKILLLQVYRLFDISSKYYIKITNNGQVYSLVSIKTHLINVRQILSTGMKYQFSSNSSNQDQGEKIDLGTDQEDLGILYYASNVQRRRKSSTEISLKVYNIQFNFTDVNCMRQFCSLIFSSKDEHFKPNENTLYEGKVKLNMRYVVKPDDKNYDFLFEKQIEEIKQSSDKMTMNNRIITKLLYKMYVKTLELANNPQQTILRPFAQLLKDNYQADQPQIKCARTQIQIKLFSGNYKQVIDIYQLNHQKFRIDDNSFPILKGICLICRNLQNKDNKITQIIKTSDYQHYEKKVLIQFLNYCQNNPLQEHEAENQIITIQPDFNTAEGAWNQDDISNFIHPDYRSQKINVTWEIDRADQLPTINSEIFYITVKWPGLNEAQVQFKLKTLIGLIKPYKDIERKGVCRVLNIQRVNKQIILKIDVNPITSNSFLDQEGFKFYSQLWFKKRQSGKQYYEKLILRKREQLYKKQKQDEELWMLYEFGQYLIRETVRNLLLMTIKLPACTITPYDFIYFGRQNYCQSISINPFFEILHKLNMSSSEPQLNEREQLRAKTMLDHPLASNMINSQLLDLMMLRRCQEITYPVDKDYQDRQYYLICSQSFWNQYLSAMRCIINKNNNYDKYFFEKLPLLKAPLQKIFLFTNSFQDMNRLENASISHITQNILNSLTQLHLTFYGLIDSRCHGIIHYQALLFILKNQQRRVFNKLSQIRWDIEIENTRSQFITGILQNKGTSSFFDSMRRIRNFFCHKTYENKDKNKEQKIQIQIKQKLRIITSSYPCFSTFLFERVDEFAAFSVQQVLKIRVQRCNKLIQIHTNQSMGHQYVRFSNYTYFTQLIDTIKDYLVNHGKMFNNRTNQLSKCQKNQCNGHYIRKNLIIPIQTKINKQWLSKIDFSFVKFEINCRQLQNVKIGRNSIIHAIIHLMYLYQQYLKIQISQFLFERVKIIQN